jgi:hypothetical protein
MSLLINIPRRRMWYKWRRKLRKPSSNNYNSRKMKITAVLREQLGVISHMFPLMGPRYP